MARRRSARRLLRMLAHHWKEGLILVGLNLWVFSEISHQAVMDALSDRTHGEPLTPQEREEFERLVRQVRS